MSPARAAPKTATISLRVDPALKARLVEMAEAEGRTLANFLEWRLRQLVEEKDRQT